MHPQALIDTGSSYIRVPAADFDNLVAILKDSYNESCSLNEQTGLLECHCGLRGGPQDFPSLQVAFTPADPLQGLKYYQLLPDDYISKVGLTCQFKLNRIPSTSKTAKWVLGATFLQKHYSVFDLEQKSIGIVQSRNYDATKTQGKNWWPQAKFYFLRICLVISIAYFIYELVFVRIIQERLGLCLRVR